MFAYNKVSDLKDGSLVVPLRLEGDNVICLDENNNEITCSFDDFDFDKTEAERLIVVDDGESSTQNDEEESTEETESETEKASDEETESTESTTEASNSHQWIEDNKTKADILSMFNITPKKNIRDINIIKFL